MMNKVIAAEARRTRWAGGRTLTAISYKLSELRSFTLYFVNTKCCSGLRRIHCFYLVAMVINALTAIQALADPGTENPTERTHLRSLAEKGDVTAQYILCIMMAEGVNGPEDDDGAVNWCRAAAAQGDPEAQYSLALMYDKWHGVTQDHAEAAKWYEKAAEQGLDNAAYNLGVLYTRGQGVTKDYADAMKWYRKAASQENTRAEAALGEMYQDGRGTVRDDAESLSWYLKAAKGGDFSARWRFITLYAYNLIPPEEIETVKQWGRERARQNAHINNMDWYSAYKSVDYAAQKRIFQTLADQGNARSQELLAHLYDEGLGVSRDYVTAVHWYSKAAEGGDPVAQVKLAEMYEQGQGTTRDDVQAYKWLTIAAPYFPAADDERQGKTIRQRDLLGKTMTSEHIKEATLLAKEWQGNKYNSY